MYMSGSVGWCLYALFLRILFFSRFFFLLTSSAFPHLCRSFVELIYFDLNDRQAVYIEVNELAACLSLWVEFYFFL